MLCNENVSTADKITYYPIYMIMFLEKEAAKDDMIYTPDFSILRAVKIFKEYSRKVRSRPGWYSLRKIEVPCSDDVADSCLRIVGLIVRLPKTSVAT